MKYKHKKIKETSVLNRRSTGEKILFGIVFFVLSVHCLTLILPVVWVFLSSLKTADEYNFGNVFSMPEKLMFSNYVNAFESLNAGDTTFIGMIANSLWYTAICATLSAFMPLVTGYVLSKYRFKAKTFIYTVAITSLTIPLVGTTASYLKIIHWLGVYDTPFFVVLTSLNGFGGTFIIYYGYYKNVSWSYAEAGMMDGASPFVIFFKIMLPQAMPIFWTFIITGVIACWNEYYVMIMFIPSYPSISSGLYAFQANTGHEFPYPTYFAGVIISMIPSIVLFSIFADKIMTTVSVGGLKG